MTHQSIVKSVTMDEAVLQSGDGSDEQDQIDVEENEVVADESLISLLNQKTITLSSKVDTVELEKAKESQYEYTGVEGDNFVMRYVGRVVRSLVSVAPEHQKEADELIDYARGEFMESEMESQFLEMAFQSDVKMDFFVALSALLADIAITQVTGRYTLFGFCYWSVIVFLICAQVVVFLFPRSAFVAAYRVLLFLFSCGYLYLLFLGGIWIGFVNIDDYPFVSVFYGMQAFQAMEVAGLIVCLSQSIRQSITAFGIMFVAQIIMFSVKWVPIYGFKFFIGIMSNLYTLQAFIICILFKLKYAVVCRLKINDMFWNSPVGYSSQVTVSQLLVHLLCSFSLFFMERSLINPVSFARCFVLIFAIYMGSRTPWLKNSSATIWRHLILLFVAVDVLHFIDCAYLIVFCTLTRDQLRLIYGAFFASMGSSQLAISVQIIGWKKQVVFGIFAALLCFMLSLLGQILRLDVGESFQYGICQVFLNALLSWKLYKHHSQNSK